MRPALFAVKDSIESFPEGSTESLDSPSFSLGEASMEISIEGNVVSIRLLKTES